MLDIDMRTKLIFLLPLHLLRPSANREIQLVLKKTKMKKRGMK